MTKRSAVNATFTIERDYGAAPARVFKAFADIDSKRRWFAEGEGWTVEEFVSDFRTGGFERSRFRFQGGELITNETTYHDVVPNERIIIAYSMSMKGQPFSVSLATMEFETRGTGTRFKFTEQGAYLDGTDNVGQREEGTRELLNALERELKRPIAA